MLPMLAATIINPTHELETPDMDTNIPKTSREILKHVQNASSAHCSLLVIFSGYEWGFYLVAEQRNGKRQVSPRFCAVVVLVTEFQKCQQVVISQLLRKPIRMKAARIFNDGQKMPHFSTAF